MAYSVRAFIGSVAVFLLLLAGCATGSPPSTPFNPGVPGGPNPGATCGRANLACCTTGQQCTDGSMCQEGRCRSNTDCGNEGQSCCGTNQCNEASTGAGGVLLCDSSRRCVRRTDCGQRDGMCCTSGTPCSGSLVCSPQTNRCTPTTTAMCGGDGQACCPAPTPCQTGYSCGGDNRCSRAASCGGPNAACCATNPPCNTGLDCNSGYCQTRTIPGDGGTTPTCGGRNQACCTTGPQCAMADLTCCGAGGTGMGGMAGTCVDTRADDRNCGMCGTTCATGQRCGDRMCRAVPGTTPPPGGVDGGVPPGTLTPPGPGPGALCGGSNQVCCTGTQQCRETNLVCSANRCVTRGSTPGGPQCIAREAACTPGPTGPQCCTGLTCDATARRCRSSTAPGGGCTNDVDCANGQRCASGRCQCRASTETCTSDASCCTGLSCVSGVCQTRPGGPTPPPPRPDGGTPPPPRPDGGTPPPPRPDASTPPPPRPDASIGPRPDASTGPRPDASTPPPPRPDASVPDADAAGPPTRPDSGGPPTSRPDSGRPDGGLDAGVDGGDGSTAPVSTCPNVPAQNKCDPDNPNVLLVCDTSTSPATVERRQCLGPTLTCGWDASNNKYGCIARTTPATPAEERCRDLSDGGGHCIGTVGDTRRYYTCDANGAATEATCSDTELCQENSGYAYCSSINRDPRCQGKARGEGGCVGTNARYECDAYGQATEITCGTQVCVEAGGYGRCRPSESASLDGECASQEDGWGRCTSGTAGFNCAAHLAVPVTCTGMQQCAIVDGGAACRMPSSITADPRCAEINADYFWCVGNVRTSCSGQGLWIETTCNLGCVDNDDGEAYCNGGITTETNSDGRCGESDTWSECFNEGQSIRRCNAGMLSEQSCEIGCEATDLGIAECSSDYRCYNSAFYGAQYCFAGGELLTCDANNRIIDTRTCPHGCGGSFDGWDYCNDPPESGPSGCGTMMNGETRCDDNMLVTCMDGELHHQNCGEEQCRGWETPASCGPAIAFGDCETNFHSGEHRCTDWYNSEWCDFGTPVPSECGDAGCNWETGECNPTETVSEDCEGGSFRNGTYRCDGDSELYCNAGTVWPGDHCGDRGCNATTGRCNAVPEMPPVPSDDCEDQGLSNMAYQCSADSNTSHLCWYGGIVDYTCNPGGCVWESGQCDPCRYNGVDIGSTVSCFDDEYAASCDGTNINWVPCGEGRHCSGGECIDDVS